MSEIEAFWIINWDGIPLYNYSSTNECDPSLISGFFSAIQSFARDISTSNEIDSMDFGDKTYTFLSNAVRRLYFISKSNGNMKKKVIMTHLKNVEALFLKEFCSQIELNCNQTSLFERFQVSFKRSLRDSFKKLEGIW